MSSCLFPTQLVRSTYLSNGLTHFEDKLILACKPQTFTPKLGIKSAARKVVYLNHKNIPKFMLRLGSELFT